MFFLLANLETRKVRVGELKLVFLFEVLHHTTVVCVTRLHCQGEPDKQVKISKLGNEKELVASIRLSRGWSSGDIAHPVLSPYGASVGDFNLQSCERISWTGDIYYLHVTTVCMWYCSVQCTCTSAGLANSSGAHSTTHKYIKAELESG